MLGDTIQCHNNHYKIITPEPNSESEIDSDSDGSEYDDVNDGTNEFQILD